MCAYKKVKLFVPLFEEKEKGYAPCVALLVLMLPMSSPSPYFSHT